MYWVSSAPLWTFLFSRSRGMTTVRSRMMMGVNVRRNAHGKIAKFFRARRNNVKELQISLQNQFQTVRG